MSTAPGVPLKRPLNARLEWPLNARLEWRSPRYGYLVPSDAPGFGIELTREEIESAAI